jgi:hypothetical protein
MSGSDDNGSPGAPEKAETGGQSEHLNIKVTDNNNEVFFKIKRTTALKKLMDAFCERQGKAPTSVRFLFDGSRVQPTDSPETVSILLLNTRHHSLSSDSSKNSDVEADKLVLNSLTWQMEIRWRFIRSKSAARTEWDCLHGMHICWISSGDGP